MDVVEILYAFDIEGFLYACEDEQWVLFFHHKQRAVVSLCFDMFQLMQWSWCYLCHRFVNSAASGGSNATCLVDVRFNAAMKSKCSMPRPAAKKPRSAGTKKNPTCSICSSHKHYGSSCPVLAQKLLKAVRRKSGLQNIVQTLAQRDVVSLVEAPPKPRRTLKRRSRGNKFASKKAKQAGSKRKRKKNSTQRLQPYTFSSKSDIGKRFYYQKRFW